MAGTVIGSLWQAGVANMILHGNDCASQGRTNPGEGGASRAADPPRRRCGAHTKNQRRELRGPAVFGQGGKRAGKQSFLVGP